jgi:hypothetical protein
MRTTVELFDLMGYRIEDKITGLQGVATSVSFDVYGCQTVLLNPGIDKDGKLRESVWLDEARVDKKHGIRVMEPPDFLGTRKSTDNKGPELKPIPGNK